MRHAALFMPLAAGYHDFMRIACTSCNAVYDLPPERVRPGRGVKCARCATVWVPVALVDAEPEIQPLPESAPPAKAVPEPEPVREKAPGVVPDPVIEAAPEAAPQAAGNKAPMQEPATAGRSLALVGWLLTFVVLAGLGWSGVTFRANVMQAWPPSERVYRLVGLV